MNLTQIKAFCNMQTNSIFGTMDEEILFINHIGQEAYPHINEGDSIWALLPQGVLEKQEGDKPVTLTIAEEEVCIQAAIMGEFTVYTLVPKVMPSYSMLLRNLCNIMRQKLMLAHMVKDQLSTASHDPQQLRKNLQFLSKVYYQLERLCDNTDYFIRFQEGEIALRLERIEFVSFMKDLVATVAYAAKELGFSIQFHSHLQSLETGIDPGKITKLLLTLMCNSMKCMSQGDKLDVSLKQSGKHLIIKITDKVSQIKEEHLTEIAYLRDLAQLPPETGLGLGLTLAQEIVDLHKGAIVVDKTQTGKGATVAISLPIRKLAAEDILRQERNIYRESSDTMRAILVELSEVLDNGAYGKNYLG